MDIDISKYFSHPDKLLQTHLQNVAEFCKKSTNSKLMELVALFHDVGKVNKNFQLKIKGGQPGGYCNHAYLSAYALFCYLKSNKAILEQNVSGHVNLINAVIALVVIVAKHHGNLPDFMPKEPYSILSLEGIKDMQSYLKTDMDSISDFVSYITGEECNVMLSNQNNLRIFSKCFTFSKNDYDLSLDFYLKVQNIFSILIKADKTDAGNFSDIFQDSICKVEEFSKCYPQVLDLYLSNLNSVSPINVLRTRIREKAIENIRQGLKSNWHVFELTAPTGAGKTLMLLSLASEIEKVKGSKRIIYGLPFLSITEQVETEVLKIFKGYEDFICRFDSKSSNSEYSKLQESMNSNPTIENFRELNKLEYLENTFSYPFIITTFVRFFETLLSNNNKELLKLNNFSHCIFLLDEIQALPPRLYGFFIAYLSEFCVRYDSYAVISTATQPNFILPGGDLEIKRFFHRYIAPYKLLPLYYFENSLFDRYTIRCDRGCINIDNLADRVLEEKKSTLVILNTISDTKKLYDILINANINCPVFLLNTHFTPRDRMLKIYLVKRLLRKGAKVILISTQLIEAGVDIDFPILYRDFTTISSIIQSAGRCNRNGNIKEGGIVNLICLKDENGIRSDLIFRGKDKEMLRITRDVLKDNSYKESEMLSVQQKFFNDIKDKMLFGKYGKDLSSDFLQDISKCMFEKIGKFSLIDNSIFGEECLYYVPLNKKDRMFEELLSLKQKLSTAVDDGQDLVVIKAIKRLFNNHLKRMSNRIVQVRIQKNQEKPLLSSDLCVCDIYKIDSACYDFYRGIHLEGKEFLL